MHLNTRIFLAFAAGLLIFACGFTLSQAKEVFPLQLEVMDDSVNVRADSTVNSEVICKLNQGDLILAFSEFYDWYRVALPKQAAVFVKDNLAAGLDSKTVKIIKDSVNIRLHPAQSAPIVGMAQKGQALTLLSHDSGWYKVEPTESCFGWLHKRFVKKAPVLPKKAGAKIEGADIKSNTQNENKPDDTFTAVGILSRYGWIFKKPYTHKIVTQDNKIFLLKAESQLLEPVVRHNVKITGRINNGLSQKYPVIEVTRMEALD